MSEDCDTKGVDHDRLLKEASTLATQFDALRFLKKVTEQFRTRAFIVLRVPSATVQAIQAASVITSWPSELLAKYDAEGLLPASFLMNHIRTSSLPTVMEIDR